jgi:hypothetical protein
MFRLMMLVAQLSQGFRGRLEPVLFMLEFVCTLVSCQLTLLRFRFYDTSAV